MLSRSLLRYSLDEFGDGTYRKKYSLGMTVQSQETKLPVKPKRGVILCIRHDRERFAGDRC